MLSSVVGRSMALSQTKIWFVTGDTELASPVSPSEAPPASVASNQVELSVEYSMPEILFDEPVSAGYIRVQETRSYGSVYVGTAMFGDFDGDGQVCRNDLNVLLEYRNQPASEFPQGDLDGDGTITVLDARKLVLLCTNPRCACS